MKSFTDYTTLQEGKNTHMTHVEDAILYGGVSGAREAIFALRGLRDMLAGKGKGSVSVKWDGAPAVFAGIDPTDGKFFVAKKGIFNKNPKVYKTAQEVDADTSGDLSDKLKDALKYLPELGIKGVVQGDFLYSNSDLKTVKVDGEQYVTFHPNTIVYAFPKDSNEAKAIQKSKIGIVWHTTYVGDSFENMSAKFGVDTSKFNRSSNVWSINAMLPDATNVTMSEKETAEITKKLSAIGKLFQSISGSTLRQLEAHAELPQLIEQYNNTHVRAGKAIPNARAHTAGLMKWIEDKFQKEIDKRKSEKGKTTQRQKRDLILSFFDKKNTPNLIKLFELQKLMVECKITLINKLNKMNRSSKFVRTAKGYQVTGEEGFVAIDRLGDNALKIVDRMEFSFNNFSNSVIKGWETDTRR